MTSAELVPLLEALLAPLFLLSTALKLVDPAGFIAALRRYSIAGDRATTVIGWAVMVGEAIVAGLLIARRWSFLALCLGFAMIVLFTVAMATVLVRGRRVPCGCFGAADETLVGWGTLLRNAVLGVMLAGAIIGRIRGLENALTTEDWLLLLAAGSALWLGIAQVTLASKAFVVRTER